MVARLTPFEISLLALDTAHTPAHLGSIHVLDPGPDGVDVERLTAAIGNRLAYVPRYRERVRELPVPLAGPVWVEDDRFDLTFHVRRAALPRPGTLGELREFAGEVLAHRLDRTRPLWEVYVVEGLPEGRFALVTKSSLALVDGVDGVELGQVLMDSEPETGEEVPDGWRPLPAPSAAELVVGALRQSAQDPQLAVANVQGALTSALGVAIALGDAAGGLGGVLGRLVGEVLSGGRPRAASPLAGSPSEQRRVATVTLSLADLRAARPTSADTVHDVVLAVLTGALRSWLLVRGAAVSAGSSLAALVPRSILDEDGPLTSLGSTVAPYVQELPVGEPDPRARLRQVAEGSRSYEDRRRAVGARTLADLAGFAPGTLHALAARTGLGAVRAPYDLLISNAPGPQLPVYAGGAALSASYPVLPLTPGHLLAVGITSYQGEVSVGLTADRDGVPDLGVLVGGLTEALAELLDTASPGHQDGSRSGPGHGPDR